MKNAIRVTIDYVKNDVISSITEALKDMDDNGNEGE